MEAKLVFEIVCLLLYNIKIMNTEQQITSLSEFIQNAHSIFVMTGAGISTESGIPDFRSNTGIYSQYPEIVFDIDVFYKDPNVLYSLMFKLFPLIRNAKPNTAHICLRKLEDAGKIAIIATQNIDMLHEKAGSRRIANLHGSLATGTCIKCGEKYDFSYMANFVERKEIPRCKCGGVIRPDFVFFKEPLPMDAIQRTENAAKKADLVIVLGSTLLIYPAGQLPLLAVTRGAPLAIITKGPTSLDNYANLKIEADIGEVCNGLMQRLNLE